MIDENKKADDIREDSSRFIKCYWCSTTILKTDNFCLRCGKNQSVGKRSCLVDADITSTKS